MSANCLIGVPDGPFDVLRILEPDAFERVCLAVGSGALPADTFLRLDSLGDGTTEASDVEQANLRWKTLLELDEFADRPESLPIRTRNLVYGEAPRALLVWRPKQMAHFLHTHYEEPFFVKHDLAEVIRQRRVEQGKTVMRVPHDRRWRPPEDIEWGQCMRISHAVWSVLASRIAPEWLESNALEYFYRAVKNGKKIDIGEEPQEMHRRIVGAVALKSSHIKNVYDESLNVGVKGIGPVGNYDLGTLLSDEYPELL